MNVTHSDKRSSLLRYEVSYGSKKRFYDLIKLFRALLYQIDPLYNCAENFPVVIKLSSLLKKFQKGYVGSAPGPNVDLAMF